ncbi:MAG: hypothetical protein KA118_19660 [Verrucomicrobia bacterium]|nr:hypothetical protein [Verrucomicrobiota bacterium]
MENARDLTRDDRSSQPGTSSDRLSRRVLFAFVLTFAASRAVVFLIMAGQIPNLFLYLHGTHVHHLNYGIVLLSLVGGYALLARPEGRLRERTALAYGAALALTFDEFGMWLHLGGSYWQRASIDAVVLVASVLTLLAYVPSFRALRTRRPLAALLVLLFVLGFGVALFVAGNRLGRQFVPQLHELELRSMP